MSISKRTDRRGKARYTVRVEVTEPTSGKRERITVGTWGSKKEAEFQEAQALTLRERGSLLHPDTTTVAQLLDKYLTVEVPRTVRPENRQPYESVIKKHLVPALGSIQARKLTVEHVERLLADMQTRSLSSSLTTKARMRLASALRMGVRWGIIATNPAEVAKAPRISYGQATIWTLEEISAFLKVAQQDHWWPYWLLLVETGARQSEVLGLTWLDVDMERATIRLGRRTVRLLRGTPIVKDGGKSHAAGRTIDITSLSVSELRRWRTRWLEHKLSLGPDWNQDELLFTTKAGTPLSANNLRKTFDALVQTAGLPKITPHAVRKSAITYALANGGSPKAVASRVGHADSRVTLDVYSQITSSQNAQLMSIVTSLVTRSEDVS